MGRRFNTAGPNQPDISYTLPPLSRWNLEEIVSLIDTRKYFVLHAPRQTGKTTCILALVSHLNRESEYEALYVNIEAAQAARENVKSGIKTVLDMFASRAETHLKIPSIKKDVQDIWKESDESSAFYRVLKHWTLLSDKRKVLIIDEVDALIGDTLISLLRQLRSGYDERPDAFPQSVILCGVRDVRDYRIHSSRTQEIITGGSAFNIKAESLRLSNFTEQDIISLYREHTKETGQTFEEDVFPLVWEYTKGQPWLVNALADEACFKNPETKDRTKPITSEHIISAKEKLILRRDTHLDQLIDKLKEERVRRVIQPILKGDTESVDAPNDDIQYVVDLGLITRTKDGLTVSNSIYREVIPRELTFAAQLSLESHYRQVWYIDPVTNRLDFHKLLSAFQEFFRENSESWIERFDYKEAGPQLLLQAFLQRIVNGGGIISREYGLGNKRTDLFIKWYPKENDHRVSQKTVIECKLLHKSLEKTIEEGTRQTLEYADKCKADEKHLIIFDRTKDRSWDEKIFIQKGEITVWGM